MTVSWNLPIQLFTFLSYLSSAFYFEHIHTETFICLKIHIAASLKLFHMTAQQLVVFKFAMIQGPFILI